jgi:hypothetical protein
MEMFSKLGTIKLSDWWRGLVVAVIMAVLTTAYETIQKGLLEINWNTVLVAGLGAGISYVLKNMGTGQGGQILTNAQPTTPIEPSK